MTDARDRAPRADHTPAPGRTTWLHKVLLAGEVVLVYARMRGELRHHDVRQVIAHARAPRRRFRRDLPVAGRIEHARHLSRAVDRSLSALPTDSRCLIQSIVLSRLLASRGVRSRIVIGAHLEPEPFAHAWVECDGEPVSPILGYDEARLTEL